MRNKVLLINPPLYFSQGYPHAIDVSVPPLGLLYLASYINFHHKKELKAEVIDVAVSDYSLQAIGQIIKRKRPFVLGLTSMTPQLQGAIELATFVKTNFPQIKIFLGGPHVSADPGLVKRFSKIFDYAVTGEAEKTFADSLVKLTRNKRIPRIQAGEVVTNLDSLPFPDHKLIERSKYSQYESMMFSRGCPFLCYYCSRPSISRLVRYRSVNNLIKEVEAVYSTSHGYIDFQDDTLTIRKQLVAEFCQTAIDKKLKLHWRCNTRIDLVDDQLLSLMARAGCDLIHFGIEAGNERIRRDVVKKGNFTNEQIYQTIKLCKKNGIKFAGYFIIGHPGEGKRELTQTKNLILNSGIDLVGLSIPTPFPGSKLYEMARDEQIINENIIDRFARKEMGEGYAGNFPVFTTKKVKREYIYTLMKEINRKFYLKPSIMLNKLKDDLLSPSRLKQDFMDLISLISRGMSSRKPYKKPGQDEKYNLAT